MRKFALLKRLYERFRRDCSRLSEAVRKDLGWVQDFVQRLLYDRFRSDFSGIQQFRQKLWARGSLKGFACMADQVWLVVRSDHSVFVRCSGLGASACRNGLPAVGRGSGSAAVGPWWTHSGRHRCGRGPGLAAVAPWRPHNGRSVDAQWTLSGRYSGR